MKDDNLPVHKTSRDRAGNSLNLSASCTRRSSEPHARWATPRCSQAVPPRPRGRSAPGNLKCVSRVQRGPFLQEREGLLAACQGLLLMHLHNDITFIYLLFNNSREFWQQTWSWGRVRELHENIVILRKWFHHILTPGTRWLILTNSLDFFFFLPYRNDL